MSRMALKITADGELTEIDLDERGSYRTLNEALGWFEVYTFSPTVDVWISEEPLPGMSENATATRMLTKSRGVRTVIRGTAVITGGSDSDGETLGLTPEQIVTYRGIHSLS